MRHYEVLCVSTGSDLVKKKKTKQTKPADFYLILSASSKFQCGQDSNGGFTKVNST